MDVRDSVIALCRDGRAAARAVANASTDIKNRCLVDAAARLRTQRPQLLDANREDVRHGRDAGLTNALLDRLTLTEARVEAIANGVEEIAVLPDPVGETIAQWRR